MHFLNAMACLAAFVVVLPFCVFLKSFRLMPCAVRPSGDSRIACFWNCLYRGDGTTALGIVSYRKIRFGDDFEIDYLITLLFSYQCFVCHILKTFIYSPCEVICWGYLHFSLCMRDHDYYPTKFMLHCDEIL